MAANQSPLQRGPSPPVGHKIYISPDPTGQSSALEHFTPPNRHRLVLSKTKEPPERSAQLAAITQTGCALNEDVDEKHKCLEKWIVYPLASRNTRPKNMKFEIFFFKKRKRARQAATFCHQSATFADEQTLNDTNT